MKKSTYDALSTIAVIALVVSTYFAQHFSRAGYVFGVLAVLSAIGSFAVYVKALPKRSLTPEQEVRPTQTTKATEIAAVPVNRVERTEKIILRSEKEELLLKLFEDRCSDRLHTRRLQVLVDVVDRAQLKFHPVAHEPAVVIASVVEKLCASSREPRFEFILSPDGTFKIRQITVKRPTDESLPSRPDARKESATQLIN